MVLGARPHDLSEADLAGELARAGGAVVGHGPCLGLGEQALGLVDGAREGAASEAELDAGRAKLGEGLLGEAPVESCLLVGGHEVEDLGHAGVGAEHLGIGLERDGAAEAERFAQHILELVEGERGVVDVVPAQVERHEVERVALERGQALVEVALQVAVSVGRGVARERVPGEVGVARALEKHVAAAEVADVGHLDLGVVEPVGALEPLGAVEVEHIGVGVVGDAGHATGHLVGEGGVGVVEEIAVAAQQVVHRVARGVGRGLGLVVAALAAREGVGRGKRPAGVEDQLVADLHHCAAALVAAVLVGEAGGRLGQLDAVGLGVDGLGERGRGVADQARVGHGRDVGVAWADACGEEVEAGLDAGAVESAHDGAERAAAAREVGCVDLVVAGRAAPGALADEHIGEAGLLHRGDHGVGVGLAEAGDEEVGAADVGRLLAPGAAEAGGGEATGALHLGDGFGEVRPRRGHDGGAAAHERAVLCERRGGEGGGRVGVVGAVGLVEGREHDVAGLRRGRAARGGDGAEVVGQAAHGGGARQVVVVEVDVGDAGVVEPVGGGGGELHVAPAGEIDGDVVVAPSAAVVAELHLEGLSLAVAVEPQGEHAVAAEVEAAGQVAGDVAPADLRGAGVGGLVAEARGALLRPSGLARQALGHAGAGGAERRAAGGGADVGGEAHGGDGELAVVGGVGRPGDVLRDVGAHAAEGELLDPLGGAERQQREGHERTARTHAEPRGDARFGELHPQPPAPQRAAEAHGRGLVAASALPQGEQRTAGLRRRAVAARRAVDEPRQAAVGRQLEAEGPCPNRDDVRGQGTRRKAQEHS